MNPNRYFGKFGKYFLPVFILLAAATWITAALVVAFTGIREIGLLMLLVGLSASYIVARLVCPPKIGSPAQPRRQTEQNSGEVGMGGGDGDDQPVQVTRKSGNRAPFQVALPNVLTSINSWTIGIGLWILVLAAYVYFGYYWEGMPLWLALFTLSVIPACQTKFLNLLGAGKVWRGVLVYVVLVAETMLYWYYLYQLPIVPVLAGYLLLMVVTVLGARRLVVEESHVEPEPKKEGGDGQQDDAARKRKEVRQSLKDK